MELGLAGKPERGSGYMIGVCSMRWARVVAVRGSSRISIYVVRKGRGEKGGVEKRGEKGARYLQSPSIVDEFEVVAVVSAFGIPLFLEGDCCDAFALALGCVSEFDTTDGADLDREEIL